MDDPGIILLVDQQPFRQAATASLFKLWAEGNNLSVIAITTQVETLTLEAHRVKLIALSIGALGISDSGPHAWIEHLRQMFPKVAILVISDREDSNQVTAGLRARINGFIPTSWAPEMAYQALTRVFDSGFCFPSSFLRAMHRGDQSETGPGLPPDAPNLRITGLTFRQQQVFNRLRDGASNKHIARELRMRESTVKVHVRQILRKLGAANRTQAALSATMPSRDHLKPIDAPATSVVGDEKLQTSVDTDVSPAPIDRDLLASGEESNGDKKLADL